MRTLATIMSVAQHFAAEDKVQHGMDDGTLGVVRVKATQVFVTPNSFVGPATTTPSIQRGGDKATAGDILTVYTATCDEQALVNKSMTFDGTSPKPVVDFTGTVSGKALFDVSAPNVVLRGLDMRPGLVKLSSAVITSSATGLGGLQVLDHSFTHYGSTGAVSSTFGNRNAVSANYAQYRVSGGGGAVTFSGGGLMDDDLRTGLLTVSYPLIPTAHPCSGAPWNHTGTDAIVDWVLLELRNAAIAATIVARREALLQRDGDFVDVDGVSPVSFWDLPNCSYHVAVRHRNHLGVMTFTAASLSAMTTTIDFTDIGTPTYGTGAQKKVSGVNVMWTGNSRPDDRLK